MRARNLAWLGPATAVVVGLWLTRGAWGPRPPSGDDVMALIVRIDDGLRVLRAGHLDGWSSSFLTGHPQFLHYGPGLAVAAGLVRVLSFGGLSTAGTLSVLFVLAFVAVAPAVWFLARSLRLPEPAAAVAAILALVVNSPYGVGLAGLYETGLITHALAAPFVCLAIGAAVRTVNEPTRRRWPALLAASFAVVVATHVVSMLVAPLLAAGCVGVALAVRRPARGWLAALTVGIGGGLGLAAFWLLPYLLHLGERGDVTVWPTPSLVSRLGDVLAGRIGLPAGVGWLVLVGWLWAVTAGWRRYPLVVAPVVAPLAFLLFAHGLYAWFPSSDVGLQLANRGLGYAALLAVIPLATLLHHSCDRWVKSFDLTVTRMVGDGGAVAVGVAVLVVLAVSGPLGRIPRQQPLPHGSLARTAIELRGLVPDGARFATERDYPAEVARLGVRHPDFWLAARSGRNTLNTFGVELSPSPEVRFLTEFLKTPTDLVNPTARDFARYGVTHVVTLVPATTERLLASGGFARAGAHGSLTILEVLRPEGQPSPASLLTVDHGTATARLTRWVDGGEAVDIRVDSSQLTTASLAVGWARAWRLTLDGHPIPVLRRADGLVGVTLPGGAHRLALRFERGPADAVGPAISLATLAALALWCVRRRQ